MKSIFLTVISLVLCSCSCGCSNEGEEEQFGPNPGGAAATEKPQDLSH